MDQKLLESVMKDPQFTDIMLNLCESTTEFNLDDAIKDGGFYHKGVWNSLIKYKGKLCRYKVETLILDGKGNVYLQKVENGKYRIPGGSTEKICSNIEQAVRECLEEARIIVKDIIYSGVNYIENTTQKQKQWAVEHDMPIVYDAYLHELYIAKFDRYDKVFKPDPKDYDDMFKTGRFYPISDLNTTHMVALTKAGII